MDNQKLFVKLVPKSKAPAQPKKEDDSAKTQQPKSVDNKNTNKGVQQNTKVVPTQPQQKQQQQSKQQQQPQQQQVQTNQNVEVKIQVKDETQDSISKFITVKNDQNKEFYQCGDTIYGLIETENLQANAKLSIILTGYEYTLKLTEKLESQSIEDNLKQVIVKEQDEYNIEDSASESEDDQDQTDIILKKSNGRNYKVVRSEAKRLLFRSEKIIELKDLIKSLENKADKKDGQKNEDKKQNFYFSFTTSESWPGTIYYRQKKEKARVKYQMKVAYTLANEPKPQITHKTEVILRQHLKELSSENLIRQIEKKGLKKYLCFNEGETFIRVGVDQSSYVMKKEKVDILCEVDNRKCNIDVPLVQVSLVRKLEILFGKDNRILYEKTLNTVNFLDFKKGTTKDITKITNANDRKKLEDSIEQKIQVRSLKLNQVQQQEIEAKRKVDQVPLVENQPKDSQKISGLIVSESNEQENKEVQNQSEFQGPVQISGIKSLGLKSMQPTSIGFLIKSTYEIRFQTQIKEETLKLPLDEEDPSEAFYISVYDEPESFNLDQNVAYSPKDQNEFNLIISSSEENEASQFNFDVIPVREQKYALEKEDKKKKKK